MGFLFQPSEDASAPQNRFIADAGSGDPAGDLAFVFPKAVELATQEVA